MKSYSPDRSSLKIFPGCLLLSMIIAFTCLSQAASAQTRRAFLVGVERYSDAFVQRLPRAKEDAHDIGKDLEQAGFDKKNIRVVTDVKSKAEFRKQFDAFLKSINKGTLSYFILRGTASGLNRRTKIFSCLET